MCVWEVPGRLLKEEVAVQAAVAVVAVVQADRQAQRVAEVVRVASEDVEAMVEEQLSF